MKLTLYKAMTRILQAFCVVNNEETDGFRLIPVIIMSLLIVSFVAASVYVLISSLNG